MTPSRAFRVLPIVVFLACSDSTGPIDPVGSWSGQTSQNRAVAFTVTSAGITEATINYRVVGDFCTATIETTVGGAAVSIENNAFQVEFSTGSADFTVSGTFTSSSAANGTLVVDDFQCGGTVNATWTASK